MPYQQKCGVKDLFQTKKILHGFFQKKNLQKQKSKLAQITGTKIIFKLFIIGSIVLQVYVIH